jgi:trimethylamine--corrinoid protein Co-methyltransferase
MLDFLLVFSLPKLVYDDAMCGQVLHFVRDTHELGDLPVEGLLDQLMADQHLIMAPHTTEHWPSELFLPSPIVDRDNREAWLRAGGKDIDERATDEVNRRLASYRQLETDPVLDAELQRIIRSGLTDPDVALPLVAPAPEPPDAADDGPRRRPNRRRPGS